MKLTKKKKSLSDIFVILNYISSIRSQSNGNSPFYQNDQLYFPNSFSAPVVPLNARQVSSSLNSCSFSEPDTPLPRPSTNVRGQTSPVLSFITNFSWKFFKVNI